MPTDSETLTAPASSPGEVASSSPAFSLKDALSMPVEQAPSSEAPAATEAAPEAPASDTAQAEPAQADPDIPARYDQDPAWQRILQERNEARQQVEAYKAADQTLESLKAEAAQLGLKIETWDDVPAAQEAARARQQAAAQYQGWEQQAVEAARAEVDSLVEQGQIAPEMADYIREAREQQARQQVQLQSLSQQQQVQQFEMALSQTLARPEYQGVPRDFVVAFAAQGRPLDQAVQMAAQQVRQIEDAAVTRHLKANPQAAPTAPAPLPGGGPQQPGVAPDPDRRYSIGEALRMDRR